MSFTRAKNPVEDSGFNVTNWQGALSDVWGYMLFFVAALVAWGLANNFGFPVVNNLIQRLSGGRVSAGGSSGAWEGW